LQADSSDVTHLKRSRRAGLFGQTA